MQRFALLVLLAAPAWSAGAFFNILDYGARNDASLIFYSLRRKVAATC